MSKIQSTRGCLPLVDTPQADTPRQASTLADTPWTDNPRQTAPLRLEQTPLSHLLMQTPPSVRHPLPPPRRPLQRTVRILVECILVLSKPLLATLPTLYNYDKNCCVMFESKISSKDVRGCLWFHYLVSVLADVYVT